MSEITAKLSRKFPCLTIFFLLSFTAAENLTTNFFPTLEIHCERKKKVVASYTAFDLTTKCVGNTFIDTIKLTYTAKDVDKDAREIVFMAPLPPDVTVKNYSVQVGEGVQFDSVVYPRCVGEKVYKETKEEDTCGMAEVSSDIFTVSLKISSNTINGEKIVFILCWHQSAVQTFNRMHGICYEYVFPRKSYYKYGAAEKTKHAGFIDNEYGTATPSALIDLTDCYFELIGVPSDFVKQNNENKYLLNLNKKVSHDNIRFTFINSKGDNKGYKAFKFRFDNLYVLGISFVPQLSFVLNGLNVEREIIFVIDRSGSMLSSIGRLTPHEIVSSSLQHILTTCADSDIYLNLVVFNDTVDTNEDILFKKSVKLFTRGIGNESDESNVSKTKKESVADVKRTITERNMLKPRGCTDILLALKKACQIERIKNSKEATIPRNIVLLTDGRDFNVEKIRSFVSGETADGDTRFFSVGIGNGVSFKIIEDIGNFGKGAYYFLWNLENLENDFFEIIKETGSSSRKFKWEVKTRHSVMNCVQSGKLHFKDKIKPLHVPRIDDQLEIFPTKNTIVFSVFKGNMPSEIKISVGDKKETILTKEIETLTGQYESIMCDELAIGIDLMFEAEMKNKIDLLNTAKIVLTDLLESKGWSMAKTGEVDDELFNNLPIKSFIEPFKEKIDFAVNHSILTKDTLLMVGTEIKKDFKWKKTVNIDKMVAGQLLKVMKDNMQLDIEEKPKLSREQSNEDLTANSPLKHRRSSSSYQDSSDDDMGGCEVEISTECRRCNKASTPQQKNLNACFSKKSKLGTNTNNESTGKNVSNNDDLFSTITSIFEKAGNFEDTCSQLRKYMKKEEKMLMKILRSLITNTKRQGLEVDADKKLFLLLSVYYNMIKQPTECQRLTIICKMNLAEKREALKAILCNLQPRD